MNTIRTIDGRILTEREKELLLAWLAMYPVAIEIKAELEREGQVLSHEN